jgi:hypothetical protein
MSRWLPGEVYLNIGIGYSAGSNSFANTSISFFPYHTIGVAQSFRFYPPEISIGMFPRE